MQVSLYRLAVVVCPPATGPSAGSIGRRLSLSAGQLSLSVVSWPFPPFPPPRDVYVHGHLCWLIVYWPVVSNSYRASMFGAISMRQPAIGRPWLLLSVVYHFSAAGGKRSAGCWLITAAIRPLFCNGCCSATILQWPLFGHHCLANRHYSAIVRPIAVVRPPLQPLFGYHLAVIRPIAIVRPPLQPLLGYHLAAVRTPSVDVRPPCAAGRPNHSNAKRNETTSYSLYFTCLTRGFALAMASFAATL